MSDDSKPCYKCLEHQELINKHICTQNCRPPFHLGGGTHSYSPEFQEAMEAQAAIQCVTSCCQLNGCVHNL